ncbi:uncharacterized protein PAF06_007326 [Gastrophryne carolinensis]
MTSSGATVKGKMEESGQLDNKNTLKKTKFDLRIVEAFLQRAREERPLLTIPVEELDNHLANFIRTHRKQDGSEYEAGTLRGILGSLDRHFEKSAYPYAIYRSRETKFIKTVAAMKEKQSYLRNIGSKGGHPGGGLAEPLTEREIELLYATGAIGLHNPTALLYMLFFNIGLHFSLRTMEQHNLKWGDITLKADARGRKYLEHTKKLTPGRGKFHPSHTMRMQIYESPEQPERDVVKAYEKYTVERPEKMKCEDAPFYLTPQPDCRPGYARWFKNLPMGESRIRGIMKHLKMAAGLLPQRKRAGRPPLRSPVMMGSNMAAILSAQVKALRGEASVNGCRSNVLKKEEEDLYGEDHLLGPESGFTIPESDEGLTSSYISSPKLRRIKEEWEPEETMHRDRLGQRSFYPGQGSVTFHDVAASFSSEEWNSLQDWQKDLYKNVMREIHTALETMGYKIVNADVLLKIKDEESEKMSPTGDKMDSEKVSEQSIAPDILLRIKKGEVPDWRDDEDQDKEDPSSTSIPVFDPDLGMWVFKENSDANHPEDERDQQLPTDIVSFSDEGASLQSPSTYKESLPEISTLRQPMQPEVSRPGKRKRRPPQRRTSEQRPDSDDDVVEPNHRLPCRKPQPPASEERKDLIPQGKIYQCDLCERTFSDRCSLEEMCFTCPQCGGSLNPLPDQTADTKADYTQTLASIDPGPNAGFTHPSQGPVG